MQLLTRYEFGDTGIFQAMNILYDMELSQREVISLVQTENQFNTLLTIPDIFDQQKSVYSFFTSKGLDYFKKPLHSLLKLYKKAENIGFGEIVEISVDKSNLNVVYEDEFQVLAILPRKALEKIKQK